jgi:hypothetical protein
MRFARSVVQVIGDLIAARRKRHAQAALTAASQIS